MFTIKKILKLEKVRFALCWLGSLYIRFVFVTSSWKVIGNEISRKLWETGTPFILCFWHGRLLMMPYCWDKTRPIRLLTSQHRDGRLIAQTVSFFGFDSIFGSSTRGGFSALRNMVKCIEAGESVGLTPDGPRGPRMRVQEGVVALASLSGAPIVPISYSISNGKFLKSWDRFLIALPFGRGVFVWGNPISVKRNAIPKLRATLRQKVEFDLLRITNMADEETGQKVIAPDSPFFDENVEIKK